MALSAHRQHGPGIHGSLRGPTSLSRLFPQAFALIDQRSTGEIKIFRQLTLIIRDNVLVFIDLHVSPT